MEKEPKYFENIRKILSTIDDAVELYEKKNICHHIFNTTYFTDR